MGGVTSCAGGDLVDGALASQTETAPVAVAGAAELELYNRQLYVMGREAQSALGAADVLVVGVRGVGAEIGTRAFEARSPRADACARSQPSRSVSWACGRLLLLMTHRRRLRTLRRRCGRRARPAQCSVLVCLSVGKLTSVRCAAVLRRRSSA